MPFCKNRMILGAAAISSLLLAALPARADDGERAIWARLGFMNLVSWEAGPLFAMAKGDMAYDAAAAQEHAARLQMLYQYPFPSLFLQGTSKEDRPGKTRALPEIWQDQAKFEAAFSHEREAVAGLADKVGSGQPALVEAVGALGKGCGDCHNAFRAKDY